MPEENLARRSREARRRFKTLYDQFHEELKKDESWWHELEAKRAEAKGKADAGDPEGAKKLYEEAIVFASKHIDTEKMRADEAEVDAVLEELEHVRMEASIEGAKLRNDALKQQATFSGAAIVGVAAITRGALPHIGTPLSNVLLISIYVVLLTTICTSLLLMHIENVDVERTLLRGERLDRGRLVRWGHFGSTLGLPIAVVLFGVYESVNLSG
jgi:hypothetical protein